MHIYTYSTHTGSIKRKRGREKKTDNEIQFTEVDNITNPNHRHLSFWIYLRLLLMKGPSSRFAAE